jgi:general secretion pathway protein G
MSGGSAPGRGALQLKGIGMDLTVQVVLGAIAVAMPVLGLALVVMGAQRVVGGCRRRPPDEPDPDEPPRCRQCEYLLIGIQSQRCPECGTILSPDNVVHGERRRNAHQAVGGVGVLALGIVLMAALIVPKFTGRAIYPKTAAASTDIMSLKIALDAFQIDFGRYPTTAEGLNVLVNPPNGSHAYIDKVPIDPWGTPYIYRVPGKNGQDFDLFSCGPDGIPYTADDIK